MMNSFKAAALAAVASYALSVQAQTPAAPVVAQPIVDTPVMATPRPNADGANPMLPANTEIWLSPNAEVNTKTVKVGDKFAMSTTRDVLLGNYIVIPRGTRGTGQISMRTGKGAFGKSGKMEFEIVSVELNGRTIPTTGHYRIEGQGNTGATVGAVVAVGVFAAFVTGRSASVPTTSEFRAFTSSALPVTAGSAAAAAASAEPVKTSWTDGVKSLPAKTASGFCLDVPASYFGTGTDKYPTPTAKLPRCVDVK